MTKSIVCIGEALWDLFPDERHAGGAPTNVAFHAARLGNEARIITRVGEDEPGEQLVAYLREHGVHTELVQRDSEKATGTVRVDVQNGEPCYTIKTDVAWDYIEATDEARAQAGMADAVCFSSLAQRCETTRSTIQQLVADARGQALIVFDVNLRPPFVSADVLLASLRLSDVVKMGESELSHVARLLGQSDLVSWLTGEVGIGSVCVTRGARGASLTTRSSRTEVEGAPVDTSGGDAVGAGDAFLAALTHRLVHGGRGEDALQFANAYAALVASKRGAMPMLSAAELEHMGA